MRPTHVRGTLRPETHSRWFSTAHVLHFCSYCTLTTYSREEENLYPRPPPHPLHASTVTVHTGSRWAIGAPVLLWVMACRRVRIKVCRTGVKEVNLLTRRAQVSDKLSSEENKPSVQLREKRRYVDQDCKTSHFFFFFFFLQNVLQALSTRLHPTPTGKPFYHRNALFKHGYSSSNWSMTWLFSLSSIRFKHFKRKENERIRFFHF